MKRVPTSLSFQATDNDPLPNPILVAQQIEGLRVVLRRMKAAKTSAIDPLISKKLQNFAHQ